MAANILSKSLWATVVMQGGDQLRGHVLQQDQARVQGDADEARHDHEQGWDIHQVQPERRHKYPRVLPLHAMRAWYKCHGWNVDQNGCKKHNTQYCTFDVWHHRRCSIFWQRNSRKRQAWILQTKKISKDFWFAKIKRVAAKYLWWHLFTLTLGT